MPDNGGIYRPYLRLFAISYLRGDGREKMGEIFGSFAGLRASAFRLRRKAAAKDRGGHRGNGDPLP